MKRGYPPVRLSLLILMLALLWRMLGAPLTGEQWRSLDVPFWQARTLLPGRLERVFQLWCGGGEGHVPGGSSQSQSISDENLILLGARAEEPVLLQVWNDQSGKMETMELETYVYGVLAAEMPAAYHMEALRAQAVAARTRAVCQQAGEGCSLAEGADVCTRSGHCQGYAARDSLLEKWGNEYAIYQQRLVEAVGTTQGQVLTYDGSPIEVMYHAISGGRTEDVQAVFARSLPYLVSVDSPEEGVRGYRQDTRFSLGEAAQLLAKAFPKLNITPEGLQKTLVIASHTATGRVESLLLCNGQVDATDFRKALGLRSTMFTFTMDADSITFHQTGYGHGVGMSQAGANRMAADGNLYEEILSHYYPGTTLEKQ